jgi:hypothetical protein
MCSFASSCLPVSCRHICGASPRNSRYDHPSQTRDLAESGKAAPPPQPLKAVRTAETRATSTFSHEALQPRHSTSNRQSHPYHSFLSSLLFSSRSRFTITHRPLHSCLDDNHQIAKPRNLLRQALRRNSTRDDNSRTLASLSSPAFKGLLVARDFEDPFLLGKHLTTQEDPV